MRLALFAAAFAATIVPAAADTFYVTEYNSGGVSYAQGSWSFTATGGKLAGKAELQLQNGTPLTYAIEGEAAAGVYTVKMDDRSDNKKSCIWTGKPKPDTPIVYGEVKCDGNLTFSVKASH